MADRTLYVPEAAPLYANEDETDSLDRVVSSIAAGQTFKIAPISVDRYKKLPLNKQPSTAVPAEVRNKLHNRHLDVLPNPRTRVVLPEVGDDPTTAYLNANFVRGAQGQKNMYICTQGPQAASVHNFWRMVWGNGVSTICMLTNLVEKGKRKCEQYWPAKEGEKVKFDGLSVTLASTVDQGAFSHSTLELKSGAETRTVGHFYYSTWPDHGAPKNAAGELDPSGLLGMLERAKDWQRSQPHSDAPMVVHCSAGVGRAGTAIALDHAIEMLNLNKEIDPIQVIHEIRHDRVALVQTALQYKYLHAGCVAYVRSIGGTPQESDEAVIDVSLETEEQQPVAMVDDNPLQTPAVVAAQARYDASLRELDSVRASLPPPYVFGLVGKDDIDALLNGQPNGAFFARKKFKKEPGTGVFILVVKFRDQPTHHALGEDDDGYTTVNGQRFGDAKTLDELVEFLGNIRPNWPVALKHPIRNPSKPLALEEAETQLKQSEAILEDAKAKAVSDPTAIPVLAEPRYEEPVPQRTSSMRSMSKRRSSSTSLNKIAKKRASVHKKVTDLQGKLADLNRQLVLLRAQLNLYPAYLHPEPYPRSKCIELFNDQPDGTFFVRKMLPAELQRLPGSEGLILVVKFRDTDTHHVLGRDSTGNLTIGQQNLGPCSAIGELETLLAKPQPKWPIALHNPVPYKPETKEHKNARKKYEDMLKQIDKLQISVAQESEKFKGLDQDEQDLAKLAATGNTKVAEELRKKEEEEARKQAEAEKERELKLAEAREKQEEAVRLAAEEAEKQAKLEAEVAAAAAAASAEPEPEAPTGPLSKEQISDRLDALVSDLPYFLGVVTAAICEKTLADSQDGSYFIRKRMDSEPIPAHIKYMLVVRFRSKPTHHIVYMDPARCISINGQKFGDCLSFADLINALGTATKKWPVALRFPVLKQATPDAEMLPPVTPKMRRPFSVAQEAGEEEEEIVPAAQTAPAPVAAAAAAAGTPAKASKKAEPAKAPEPEPPKVDLAAQRAKAERLVERSNKMKDLRKELDQLRAKMRDLETKATQASDRSMELQAKQSSAEVKLTVLNTEAHRAEVKAETETESERARLRRATGQTLWSQLPFANSEYLENRLERTFAGLVAYSKDDQPPPPLGEHDQFGFDTHRDLETNQVLAILAVM